METMDLILREMYRVVNSLEKPDDFPVESAKVSQALAMKQPEFLHKVRLLSEEGMLKISPLCQPPLLYLTQTGLARARRLLFLPPTGP